jgi:hypothetical protein
MDLNIEIYIFLAFLISLILINVVALTLINIYLSFIKV